MNLQAQLYVIQILKKESDGSIKEIGFISEWYKQEKSLQGSSTRVRKYTKEEANIKASTLEELGYITRIIEDFYYDKKDDTPTVD